MSEVKDRVFEDIRLNDVASFDVDVTEEMVDQFAVLSGDYNPLHTDHVYASTSPFKRRVCHGMLGAAFFSRLIGMSLPGKRSTLLSMQIFFRKPLFFNMRVHIMGTVTQKIEAARSLKVSLVLQDRATGDVLTDGTALVKVL